LLSSIFRDRPATRQGRSGDAAWSFTILIVDDNALIRHCLRSCIEREREWKVCGEAENGQVAVEKVKKLNPDVVILDWQMPVMGGLDAARHIACIAPKTAMVMLTLHQENQLLKEAQKVGIRHVLTKTDAVPGKIIVLAERSVWIQARGRRLIRGLPHHPDTVMNEYGARGIGEIGLTGCASAIASGTYHAAGVRVRELPIRIELSHTPGDNIEEEVALDDAMYALHALRNTYQCGRPSGEFTAAVA
jgi:CheY-like chemotaxis protein